MSPTAPTVRDGVEKAIANRHSVRRYDARGLERPVVEAVLRAGVLAPSAKNRQPWRFTVVVSPEARIGVAEAMLDAADVMVSRFDGSPKEGRNIGSLVESALTVAEAPCLVLVRYACDESWSHGRERAWGLGISDIEAVDILGVGACMENMALEATALGLGSLWNCDVLYAQEALAEAFGLGDQLVAAMVLGYEEEREATERTSRRPLSEVCTWV